MITRRKTEVWLVVAALIISLFVIDAIAARGGGSRGGGSRGGSSMRSAGQSRTGHSSHISRGHSSRQQSSFNTPRHQGTSRIHSRNTGRNRRGNFSNQSRVRRSHFANTRRSISSGKHISTTRNRRRNVGTTTRTTRRGFSLDRHTNRTRENGRFRGIHRSDRRGNQEFGRRIHGSSRNGFKHRGQVFDHIVGRNHSTAVRYRHGHNRGFNHIYPYYHRKYLFISFGGYWPYYYGYRRYYWYGYHPYYWYGAYPYPYYGYDGGTYYYSYEPYSQEDTTYPQEEKGYDDFSDVRERLERQKEKTKTEEQPGPETVTDRYFDEGVKAFEAGDFEEAVKKFESAANLEPDDVVLPFAYSQALFSVGRYSKAAQVLREAIEKSAEKQGAFYPRGLYSDDNILQQHVERLAKAVRLVPENADFQLLLGYQLLGLGKYDEALLTLKKAEYDQTNKKAAQILTKLLNDLMQSQNDNTEKKY